MFIWIRPPGFHFFEFYSNNIYKANSSALRQNAEESLCTYFIQSQDGPSYGQKVPFLSSSTPRRAALDFLIPPYPE
jgi:hypothetical protein